MSLFGDIKQTIAGAVPKAHIVKTEKAMCALLAAQDPQFAPLTTAEGQLYWRKLHDQFMTDVYVAKNKREQLIAVRNALMQVAEQKVAAYLIATADSGEPMRSFLCALYMPEKTEADALQMVVNNFGMLPITETVLLDVSRRLGDDTGWFKMYNYAYRKFLKMVHSVKYSESQGNVDPSRLIVDMFERQLDVIRQDIRAGANWKDFDEEALANNDANGLR